MELNNFKNKSKLHSKLFKIEFIAVRLSFSHVKLFRVDDSQSTAKSSKYTFPVCILKYNLFNRCDNFHIHRCINYTCIHKSIADRRHLLIIKMLI